MADLKGPFDLTEELWREYDFGGRVYRIEAPQKLWYSAGGSTHRVQDASGVIHCVPVPGKDGCALRWMTRDVKNPVQF